MGNFIRDMIFHFQLSHGRYCKTCQLRTRVYTLATKWLITCVSQWIIQLWYDTYKTLHLLKNARSPAPSCPPYPSMRICTTINYPTTFHFFKLQSSTVPAHIIFDVLQCSLLSCLQRRNKSKFHKKFQHMKKANDYCHTMAQKKQSCRIIPMSA